MITELLSPAGSYESFEAAIGAGADAVYVGGPAFGARAYAQNFTQEELIAEDEDMLEEDEYIDGQISLFDE